MLHTYVHTHTYICMHSKPITRGILPRGAHDHKTWVHRPQTLMNTQHLTGFKLNISGLCHDLLSMN